MTKEIHIWVITENPRDFPGKFVTRKHIAHVAGYVPTDERHVCDTLAEARAILPHGVARFPRAPGDDPVILESWL